MALVKKPSADLTFPLDSSQTLRASTALLRKISSDQTTRSSTAQKTNLLASADDDDDTTSAIPIWLILTTKKHITDKKRLKPGKIHLPHPYLSATETLRICLITADPQRQYKDLIAHPTFPIELSKKITRVIGLTKLKAKYKSFESRRQLVGEYDVFLADDRIITFLPQVLGKVFYKGGSTRPVPVSLEGKRQSRDESGNKRRKLSEGGSKVVKAEVVPVDVAKEIQRTLESALVHLAPSTTTAVKVGTSGMKAEEVQENIDAVVAGLVEKYVPQQWRNVRAVHLKGPNTVALPIWLAEELWGDEADVVEQSPAINDGKSKKRKRVLEGGAVGGEEVIEVPGPDGKMRRIERPAAKPKADLEKKPSKKRKSEAVEAVDDQADERTQKAARKEALKKQKAAAKESVNGVKAIPEARESPDGAKDTANGEVKVKRKTRAKAADLI